MNTETDEALTLEGAVAHLKEAQAAYNIAHADYQRAANEETAALTRLNQAQREVDAAIFSLKADAPCDSVWRREARAAKSKAAPF